MNLDTFKARYPEFQVPDPLIAAVLAEALTRLSVTVYGKQLDEAHGYLTAHKLACSPYGQGARLVSDDGTTVYLKQLQMLQRELVGGYGIAGDVPNLGLPPWTFPLA